MPLSIDGNRQPPRRSGRQTIPTRRVAKYNEEQRLKQGPAYPMERDDICVKWILQDRCIWWPATVISISPVFDEDHRRRATLLYHKHENYAPKQANVVFSSSNAGDRFVQTITDPNGGDCPEENAASWIRADELIEEVSDLEINSDGQLEQHCPSLGGKAPSSGDTFVGASSMRTRSRTQGRQLLKKNKTGFSSHQHSRQAKGNRLSSPITKSPERFKASSLYLSIHSERPSSINTAILE